MKRTGKAIKLCASVLLLATVISCFVACGGVQKDFVHEFCSEDGLVRAINEGHLQLLETGCYRIPEDKFFISDSIISNL